ncbi:MAG: hypothetical protein AVDCRST_MAG02-740, partial [uncultured Rubrobacteraceae bacterium]
DRDRSASPAGAEDGGDAALQRRVAGRRGPQLRVRDPDAQKGLRPPGQAGLRDGGRGGHQGARRRPHHPPRRGRAQARPGPRLRARPPDPAQQRLHVRDGRARGRL